jgi:hypothetical protein
METAASSRSPTGHLRCSAPPLSQNGSSSGDSPRLRPGPPAPRRGSRCRGERGASPGHGCQPTSAGPEPQARPEAARRRRSRRWFLAPGAVRSSSLCPRGCCPSGGPAGIESSGLGRSHGPYWARSPGDGNAARTARGRSSERSEVTAIPCAAHQSANRRVRSPYHSKVLSLRLRASPCARKSSRRSSSVTAFLASGRPRGLTMPLPPLFREDGD